MSISGLKTTTYLAFADFGNHPLAAANQQSALEGQIKKRSVPEEPIGESDCSNCNNKNIMKYV